MKLKRAFSFAIGRMAAALLAYVSPGLLLVAWSTASAQEAATPPAKKGWESVASVDLTLTRGNSRNFLGTVSLNTARKWAMDEVLLGGSAGYGETTAPDATGKETTSKTQDYLKRFGQFNHLFTEKIFSGLRIEGLHDDISSVDYRFTVSPLAGYYFIKTPATSLSVEIGPSYVDQKLAGIEQNYLGLRVGERFQHKFTSGAKVWETVEWIPQVDDLDNWILNSEAGVSAPVTKTLDVRLVAQDTFNNHPANARLKNDLKVMAGVAYRF